MSNDNEFERFLTSFQETTEDIEDYALILLDTNGIIQTWNKGVAKIKGYTAVNIIGQHFGIFYTPQERQDGIPEQLLNQAMESGIATYTGRRLRYNGSIFWGTVELRAIRGQNDAILGFTKLTRELKDETAAGSFWFDNDGILHTVAKPVSHTQEDIAAFRAQLRSALNNGKIGCVADIRQAQFPDIHNYFADPEIPEIYRAVAFVSDPRTDKNTEAMMSLLSNQMPTRVFVSRYAATQWIKALL